MSPSGKLKVYADLMSQPARAVVMFCKVAGIPFEMEPIRLKKQEHKTQAFTQLNPFQKVPVLEHDGRVLIESVAILRYLVHTQDVPDHWYPKDPYDQAKVDEYIEWQHLNTRLSCVNFSWNAWIAPVMAQKRPDPKKIEKYKAQMEATLDQVEHIWLDSGKKKYIVGGTKPTLADILACCELEQPALAGYKITEGRPALNAYMERIKSELDPHYREVHKIINHMVDTFGGKIPGLDDIPGWDGKLIRPTV